MLKASEHCGELLEVKAFEVFGYCRFCATKWLNIGVCWMEIYFRVNVERKLGTQAGVYLAQVSLYEWNI